MEKESLIDQQLADRFKQLDQSPRNGNTKIDPLVFAHFIKSGVSYYAIAHDEKRNEILCFVSNAKDISKPEWVSIKKLEEKPLFGKAAYRDASFNEISHSNLKIEPYRNSIEEYYLEQKKDMEEQMKYDNLSVPNNKEQESDNEILSEFDCIRNNSETQEWER